MYKFIRDLINSTKTMKDTTLDLFCEHQEKKDAEDFSLYVEKLASQYEVTCDYILEEFILD